MYQSDHAEVEKEGLGIHRKHKKASRRHLIARVVLYILLVALCGVAWWQISLQGYLRAKAYMDQSVDQVRQENARNAKQLEERMEGLSDEMEQLKESLNQAGSSISNSAEVQGRIDEKLEKLDNQLKELEKSLKILKEAP